MGIDLSLKSTVRGLFALLYLSSLGLYAQFELVTDSSEFEKLAAEAKASVRSFSADFVQEKHISFLSEPLVSSGELHYERPAQIQWHYKTPFEYLISIEEGSLRIVDDGNTNKIEMGGNPMFDKISQMLVATLELGALENEESYQQILEESSSEYKLSIVPTMGDVLSEYVARIEIYMSKDDEDFISDRVLIMEPDGDFTEIKIENLILSKN